MGWLCDPKPGQAAIIITRKKPVGVWTTEWYSADCECHGCWHRCGQGWPTNELAKLDRFVSAFKEKVRNCKEKRGKIKFIIHDFRKRQLELQKFCDR